MQPAYQPEPKARRFPRWSNPPPTCPKHKKRLKAEVQPMPNWVSLQMGWERKAKRKVWKCPEQDCHYCLASDNQVEMSSERRKRHGQYTEID